MLIRKKKECVAHMPSFLSKNASIKGIEGWLSIFFRSSCFLPARISKLWMR